MVEAYMIGLLPEGEAVYTDSSKPIEAQKAEAMEWPSNHDLQKVMAVVGDSITDITAAFCRMWINNADFSNTYVESDFPQIIRDTVPELVAELLADWKAEAEHRRDLRADYHASVL